jgi:hypothetical protein
VSHHGEVNMSDPFFDRPILNSPYDYPKRCWELDEAGQPTQTSTTGCSPFCLQHLNDLA